MSIEQKSTANSLMESAINSQLAQANCVTSSTWPYIVGDPYVELRTLVAEMKKAMEPTSSREKRLQARVAELEAKLAEIKKAAG